MDYTMVAAPAFKDNYIWLYINKNTKSCIVVDPGDGQAALGAAAAHDVRVSAIFITHHHADHSGGILDMLRDIGAKDNLGKAPIPVYGPRGESILGVTHKVSEGDTVSVPGFDPFAILDIPGHTKGHIAYYSAKAGILFCGDTLFAGGCGRLFEGTPEMLFNSLKKMNALPPDTLVYCAHEYTEKNLAFALTVEPHNLDLQKRYKEVCALREKQQPTIPSTLLIEQQTNPFLRTDSAEIRRYLAQSGSPVEIFAALRSLKDSF